MRIMKYIQNLHMLHLHIKHVLWLVLKQVMLRVLHQPNPIRAGYDYDACTVCMVDLGEDLGR